MYNDTKLVTDRQSSLSLSLSRSLSLSLSLSLSYTHTHSNSLDYIDPLTLQSLQKEELDSDVMEPTSSGGPLEEQGTQFIESMLLLDRCGYRKEAWHLGCLKHNDEFKPNLWVPVHSVKLC